jgi:trans-2,3-dihydro-3-hydroxyanthranilate isomerase
MEYDIHWVEVFAEQPFGGNLLPVITGADTIGGESMAAVARRFQQAETSFVQRATDGVSDYRHRIFMVSGEIPFAGHPSVGAAAVVAHMADRSSASFVQQTGAGRQPLEVTLTGTTGRVTLTQNRPEFGPTPDPGAVLDAIGVAPVHRDPALVPRIVSTGLPTLVLPLSNTDALVGARVDRQRLAEALDGLGLERRPTVYAVARAGAGRWRARAFVADVPGGEDAATGSAAGPFGAYVARFLGETATVIDQGIEMGSPSRLTVEASPADGDPVDVTGAVRIVGAGTFDVP